MHMHAVARGGMLVSSSTILVLTTLYCLSQNPSMKLDLTDATKLTMKLQGPAFTGFAGIHPGFMWILGVPTQVLPLEQQSLYPPAPRAFNRMKVFW